MSVVLSLFAVVFFGLIAFAGRNVAGGYLFAVIIPYAALATFVIGVIYRVINWARSPVPFRITTTCGQQKSLPWIKSNNLESPHNTLGVIGRMALEVLFFRSLFRNTKVELREGPKIVYGSEKTLWLGAMAFHWCFLLVLIRHNRFFLQDIPTCLFKFDYLDSMMQVGIPPVYITGVVLTLAVLFLLFRRLANPQVRYISLPADYFPLFLILAIALSGLCMRHFYKVDIPRVKELAVGLMSFHPKVPAGIGSIFYIHLFFVSILLVYFPFSKLMHMAGVFLSPTRNMANDNRARRHVNPWNPEVKFHTYQEWEDEFREKMRAAGLPLEKE